MKKKIISLVLIIAMLQSFLCAVYAATTSELNSQKSDIEDQKQKAQTQQSEVKDQISDVQTEIQALDTKISASEEEIAYYESKISDLTDSIDQKTKDINKKQEEIEENEELLQKRLVVLYEAGDTSFLDILFSSNGLLDFLSNYYMLTQLTQCDTDLIDGIEQDKQSLETAKTELEDQKTEANTVKEQKESKAKELQTQKKERQAKVNTLSAQEKELQSDIDAYNAKIKEIDNAVAAALKKAMEAEEEAKRQQQSSGGSSGTAGSTGANFDGTFAWPLDFSPRVVTSRMKYRWGRWHKGIDIGTDGVTGKRVIAAAAGTVIYSTYQSGTSANPGYGNYVIIYHGNGFATLYAHMSSKSVSMGQTVSKGQTVGYSGNTGGVAPHLHFEIRKASSVSNFFGNNWLDPLDYLPGGYTINE